jgi:hypothetical protein
MKKPYSGMLRLVALIRTDVSEEYHFHHASVARYY